MRTGIVTFYDHSNYGAVLQAYALQKVLEKTGHDAFHVSFNRTAPEVKTQGLHPFLKQVIQQGKIRDSLFAGFRKKYIREKEFSEALAKDTECFITGSDQVWNPLITSGDPVYFLQFADPGKRVSYGASFGRTLSEEYHETYRNGVKSIPFLSVREKKAAELIKSLCQRQAQRVVDPVFLLEAGEWEKVIEDEPEIRENYLLLIMVQNDTGLLMQAKAEAEEKGLSLKLITSSFFPPAGFESWCGTGVEKFLRLIHDSTKVITSSFHGLAFSLIFQKPYRIARLTAELADSNLRFDDICETFHLAEEGTGKNCADAVARAVEDSLCWLQAALSRVKAQDLPEDYAMPLGLKALQAVLLQCVGCTACEAVCGSGAVSMKRAPDGFLYPSFDLSRCTMCGSCSEICPVVKSGGAVSIRNTGKEPGFYAYKAENQVRMKSTSGGAFAILAEELVPDTRIYAAVMNADHRVVYACLKKKSEIQNFAKTFYVEAEPGDCFNAIKNDLQEGRSVLFVGDPCRVDGLLSFIGKDHPRLATIDHICNGVPSPGLWKAYMKELEKAGPVTDYLFRAKIRPNAGRCVTYVQNGETHSALFHEDPWSALYCEGYGLRKACYHCRYACTHRVSDLTLGDFHGIRGSHPEMDDGYGVSLILVNTQKGEKLAGLLAGRGVLTGVSANDSMQPRLCSPPHENGRNDLFMKEITRNGAENCHIGAVIKNYAATDRMELSGCGTHITENCHIGTVVKKYTATDRMELSGCGTPGAENCHIDAVVKNDAVTDTREQNGCRTSCPENEGK